MQWDWASSSAPRSPAGPVANQNPGAVDVEDSEMPWMEKKSGWDGIIRYSIIPKSTTLKLKGVNSELLILKIISGS